jgi:hypothetical protein
MIADRNLLLFLLFITAMMVSVLWFAFHDIQQDKVRAREHCAESFDPPLCEATYLNR